MEFCQTVDGSWKEFHNPNFITSLVLYIYMYIYITLYILHEILDKYIIVWFYIAFSKILRVILLSLFSVCIECLPPILTHSLILPNFPYKFLMCCSLFIVHHHVVVLFSIFWFLRLLQAIFIYVSRVGSRNHR